MSTRTAIVNGTVVTAADSYRADVLIDGERIVAIGENLAGDADTVVDAEGKLVLPGAIDVHTHLAMPFGGTMSCDDFTTGHVAGLHGGTTCHVDFVIQAHGETLQQALDNWRAKANGKAVADYGFHMIISDCRPEVIAEMPAMVEQGVTSFKLFLAYPGVFMVDDDVLFTVMEEAARLGALVMIHAENGPIIDRLVKRAQAAGNLAPGYHYRTRPAELEGEATERAIALANLAGSPLYVVHVTCEQAASAIARAREAGMRVWGETCPQYLYLTQDEMDRPGFEGSKFVCSPPLRTERDQQHLWHAIARDELSVVSTDHCPFRYEDQKVLGKDDFSKIPNGLPGIEERLAFMAQGAHDGRLDWNRVVELCCTNPAKLFGMPRKGAIAVGADADVVVWDPTVDKTWSQTDLHGGADYTCFEGMRTTGWPTHVFSRGELVVEAGATTDAARPGRGQFVPRTTFTFTGPDVNAAAGLAASAPVMA